MKVLAVVMSLGLLLTVVTPLQAQEPPGPPCIYPRMDQVNAHVRARVTQSNQDLDYHYLVENLPDSPEFLIRFAVEAFTPDGSLLSQMSPSIWEGRGRIADTAFHSWTTFNEPRGLAPGTSAGGFGLVRGSLPAIVSFLAWNDVEPPKFPRGEAPDTCEGADVIENSFKGTTVGPKPPPEEFVAIEFLNFLITLVHDSRQQGWITRDGAKTSLLAKLTNAKRKLEDGKTKVVKNMLKAFTNEVQATSCQEFTCRGNKPLTSEAYALLFFNGQFLRDRL